MRIEEFPTSVPVTVPDAIYEALDCVSAVYLNKSEY